MVRTPPKLPPDKRPRTRRTSLRDADGFITCPTCGVRLRGDLPRHLRIHGGEEIKFQCPFEGCNHSTSQKSNLRSHINKHRGRKAIRCQLCSFRTDDPGSFTRHKKDVHNYKPKPRIRASQLSLDLKEIVPSTRSNRLVNRRRPVQISIPPPSNIEVSPKHSDTPGSPSYNSATSPRIASALERRASRAEGAEEYVAHAEANDVPIQRHMDNTARSPSLEGYPPELYSQPSGCSPSSSDYDSASSSTPKSPLIPPDGCSIGWKDRNISLSPSPRNSPKIEQTNPLLVFWPTTPPEASVPESGVRDTDIPSFPRHKRFRSYQNYPSNCITSESSYCEAQEKNSGSCVRGNSVEKRTFAPMPDVVYNQQIPYGHTDKGSTIRYRGLEKANSDRGTKFDLMGSVGIVPRGRSVCKRDCPSSCCARIPASAILDRRSISDASGSWNKNTRPNLPPIRTVDVISHCLMQPAVPTKLTARPRSTPPPALKVPQYTRTK
ncbi:hypothetical protein VKT23_012215 [Stygiomarasmius scandens]|uniref:C2H2-type domain-containing protein n=1 Tax=Marasmiellus scandens TaxID=2682957 RepID=A0ABR1J8X6_9AGAR